MGKSCNPHGNFVKRRMETSPWVRRTASPLTRIGNRLVKSVGFRSSVHRAIKKTGKTGTLVS
jgi:hypothetical protein